MAILAQKIKGASFQADAYPRLADLMQGFCEIISASLDASYGVEETVLRATAERLDDFPLNKGSVYCFTNRESDDQAALILSTPFLKALSEASLGGEFALNEATTKPSVLEQSLGQPFAVETLGASSSLLTSPDAAAQRVVFHYTTVETDPKLLAKLFSGKSYLKFKISVCEDGKDPAEAMSCLLPFEFIERQGLLKQGVEKSAAAIDAEWRAKMLKHIHAADIDVDVIMDRYTALLSDLADLEIGQVVPLEGDAHKTLSLYLNTKDGPVHLGKGRLGAYKKKKAVKLTTSLEPPPPAS